MKHTFSALVLAALVASPAAAQTDFQWHGLVLSGQTLEIRGVNGEIRATAGSGDATVTATKTARRNNPNDVRIEVVPHAGGVLICAVYPAPDGRAPNTCDISGSNNNVRDNDTEVHFVVSVPPGVTFMGRTVNGDVDGEGLLGDADVKTVNGSVKLTTTGRGVANTVNGSISVTMGRADWKEASFKTVNGGITLKLPGSFGADLSANTVNGDIRSDFPVSVTSMDRKSIRGTIGAGGPHVTISTVNGSITLQRTQD
ncbi:MAG TPA: DUF4097 family beta strand repeat-containing protein [Vicinamibacterales bacterium]|nr:DUF4097 family beta strand repeat-containing protein [Vicinamibacterales bacterium]